MLVLEEIGLWGQKAVSSAHLLLGNTQDRAALAARLLPPAPARPQEPGESCRVWGEKSSGGSSYSNSTAENIPKNFSFWHLKSESHPFLTAWLFHPPAGVELQAWDDRGLCTFQPFANPSSQLHCHSTTAEQKPTAEASDFFSRTEPSPRTLGQQILNEKIISDPHFQETQGQKPRDSTDTGVSPSTFHLGAKGIPFRWRGAGNAILCSLSQTFGPQMSSGT